MHETPSHLARLAARTEDILKGNAKDQAAAICYRGAGDELRVLLITSLDTGRWVIPKGMVEKKESPRDAAAREAREEAGIRGKVSKKPFGYYSYMKTKEDVPCIVTVFLIEVEAAKDRFPEADQRKLEWVTPIEASRRVDEPELKGLLVRLAA